MSIKKLKYKRTFFNIEQMRGGTESIVTITNDGTIVSKYYKFGTRKVESVQKAVCSAEDFQKLCEDIETCIETADRWDLYVDDCGEELTIYHEYERIQIMDRGLGNADIDIGRIVNSFLRKYFID